MSRTKSQLRTAAQLQAIERARKGAAELLLSDARSANDHANDQARNADQALVAAEAAWATRMVGQNINLDLQLSFAGLILARERDLALRVEQRVEAERMLDQRRTSWQHLEASVRSGDDLLKRWRRDIARRSADRRDCELADRTSWKWFQQ